jgi:hypothetical protein
MSSVSIVSAKVSPREKGDSCVTLAPSSKEPVQATLAETACRLYLWGASVARNHLASILGSLPASKLKGVIRYLDGFRRITLAVARRTSPHFRKGP